MKIALSIVLYHNGSELEEAIQSVLNSDIDLMLFLIDNSKTDKLKKLAIDPRVNYVFNAENIGYGAAHNIAIRKSIMQGFRYHVVMNPDVIIGRDTLQKLAEFMDSQPKIGAAMPKVNYNNGSLQRLCKLLPTPFDLIGRRFLGNTRWAVSRNNKYELQQFSYNSILNTPCLSGCFMFLRIEALAKVGLFDERFFMYLEDYDLSRRINRDFETVFFPGANIVHGFTKGSYKSSKLLKYHMQSAIKYFNKWGWFVDEERNRLNAEVLKTIKSTN